MSSSSPSSLKNSFQNFDLPPIPSAHSRKVLVPANKTSSSSQEDKENYPVPHRNIQNNKNSGTSKSLQLLKSNHSARQFLNSQ